ncbi:MAG: hypothetical protein DRN49_01830, partial [Thaumarchaeota archaeon]
MVAKKDFLDYIGIFGGTLVGATLGEVLRSKKRGSQALFGVGLGGLLLDLFAPEEAKGFLSGLSSVAFVNVILSSERVRRFFTREEQKPKEEEEEEEEELQEEEEEEVPEVKVREFLREGAVPSGKTEIREFMKGEGEETSVDEQKFEEATTGGSKAA